MLWTISHSSPYATSDCCYYTNKWVIPTIRRWRIRCMWKWIVRIEELWSAMAARISNWDASWSCSSSVGEQGAHWISPQVGFNLTPAMDMGSARFHDSDGTGSVRGEVVPNQPTKFSIGITLSVRNWYASVVFAICKRQFSSLKDKSIITLFILNRWFGENEPIHDV